MLIIWKRRSSNMEFDWELSKVWPITTSLRIQKSNSVLMKGNETKNVIKSTPITYWKQVNVVIFYCEHTVPREKTSIAKKEAYQYCSIFSLWIPITKKKMKLRKSSISILKQTKVVRDPIKHKPLDVLEAQRWPWLCLELFFFNPSSTRKYITTI